MNKGEESTTSSANNKNRLFYGYIILIAAFCIMVAGFGTRFAFGIFFKPMANEFGWSSASTSLAFSLSVIVEGLMGVVMGALTDKFGPRAVLSLSGLLLGAGYLAMSQVCSIGLFYSVYGVIIGIGMGGFVVPLVTTINRWFTKKRGIITGVFWAGNGIGMLILSPIANWLIYNYTWRTCYLILGAFILIVVVVAAQYLKRDPSQAQLMHDGREKNTAFTYKGSNNFTLGETTGSSHFWLFNLAFFCFGYCIFTITVHIVPSAIEQGISPANSAIILAAIGMVRSVGGIGLGNTADRIGHQRTFIISLALVAVALFWVVPATMLWAYAIFALVFGLGYGGASSSQSPFAAELFGLKSYGVIYGLSCLFYTLGAALGPYITGHLFDITKSYILGFLFCGAVGVIGIASAIIIRPMRRKN